MTPPISSSVLKSPQIAAYSSVPMGEQVERLAESRNRAPGDALKAYLLTDSVAIALGFFTACLAALVANYFLPGRRLDLLIASFDVPRIAGIFLISAIALTWFQFKGQYRVRMNVWSEAQTVVSAMAAALLCDGFMQFAAKSDFSRMWLVSGWFVSAMAILALRHLYRNYLRRIGQWEVPALLVGNGMTAQATRAALDSEPQLGYRIVSQLEQLPEAFLKAGRSWRALCNAHGVNYVLIALDGAQLDQAAQPIAQLTREDIAFSISPPRHNLPVLDMAPQYFLNHNVKLLTYSSGLEQPLPQWIKRCFDVVVSASLLLLISPAMLLIVALVKRDGGPAFFGHPRVGKGGRMFQCLKFRSMVHRAAEVLEKHLAENPEARAEWQADHKLKNDPRVTRLGSFLRRSSLDELPQLLNVLRGDMSLVGPRPIVQDEVLKYACDIAHYYRVRPGITGLWQVSGRNDVTYEERVQMDSWYVRNWSLWHDVAILCKTIPALLKRSGAY